MDTITDHKIVWVGSTNKTTGRGPYRPRAIVVHIMQGSLSSVDNFFNNPHPQPPDKPVSAHYGIGRHGEIHQYVAEADTAWHAGRVSDPKWPGLMPGVNPNLYAIGIEHEGFTGEPWTSAMYESSAWLIAQIANRWSIEISAANIIRHADIYAVKAFCPGTGVDLPTLIELAHSVLLSGNHANFVAAPGVTVTQSNLHLRIGSPTSQAESAAVVPHGTRLSFIGWTSNGESVHGNSHWYRTSDDHYFWAGPTTDPVPRAGVSTSSRTGRGSLTP
ncbi:MAG: N-acetylmuramoyl-L-alanine amidase [Gemmatimonadaceae bacterium]